MIFLSPSRAELEYLLLRLELLCETDPRANLKYPLAHQQHAPPSSNRSKPAAVVAAAAAAGTPAAGAPAPAAGAAGNSNVIKRFYHQQHAPPSSNRSKPAAVVAAGTPAAGAPAPVFFSLFDDFLILLLALFLKLIISVITFCDIFFFLFLFVVLFLILFVLGDASTYWAKGTGYGHQGQVDMAILISATTRKKISNRTYASKHHYFFVLFSIRLFILV